jgi:type 2 lantibiotic biosynthesis protein LanM
MSTEPEQPDLPAAPGQSSAAWYQAATLTERLACWSETAAAQLLDDPGRNAEADRIIQRWKAQTPFESGSLFSERLAMDHLTEHDLLALLAEPVEALARRLGSPCAPEWVSALTQATGSPASVPVAEQNREYCAQQFALIQPLYPLLHTSIASVQEGITALAQHNASTPFDPHTLLSLLLPALFRSIEQQVSKTIVLELHVARLRGLLDKETPRERFQQYLCQLSQPAQLLSFLQEYPVLARQILLSGQLWATCSLECAQRLCADWQDICAAFRLHEDLGKLSEIRGGAGDTHCKGHSVMLLTFRSGWQLVYKPRSLRIDVHFQELLAWLNARGSHPAFRPLVILDRGAYGWSEYVTASSCRNEAEVARFYERQGCYLALLYLLEATDSHYENVIAAGEDPVFVDLEALFQHRQTSWQNSDLSPAQQALEHSVMRSLLLPVPTFFNQHGEGIEISGLSQAAGQLTPRPVPQWEAAGTDDMKLVRRHITLQGSANSPHLHGQEVQPLDYLEQIVTGFATLYRSLCAVREDIDAIWLPRFAHDEVRFIARATSVYGTILAESFHPNMLRHALKRERFLDRLWMAVASQPSLARLIPAERADLQCGDIPLFTTRPASTDLWTSSGACLPDFFAHSSLELVRQRLQSLHEEDLQRQIWIIRASFARSAAHRVIATPAGPREHTQRPGCPVSREILLAQACALGDRLEALALHDGDHADWFGLTLHQQRTWCIAAADLDLQSGLPGIILFLGYLGLVSGETRYLDLAHAGLNTLRTLLHQRAAHRDHEGIGAFTGLSSCLYLFTHLAVLWHDHSILQEAEELAPKLAGQIAQDEQFDLMNGVAGSMAILLDLYTLGQSTEILHLARACGDHLLAHALPVAAKNLLRSSFPHGTVGIAWSLFKLAAVSREEQFQRAAEATLLARRSEHGNGHALSNASPRAETSTGMSWRAGAPGLALGYLLALPYLEQASIRAELDSALSLTIAEGFGYSHAEVGPNHSLAHGDCGNLETVLVAAQTMPAQWYEHLERLTARVIETMQQQTWMTGVPLNRETPGLLFGLAGIGYQCLRLAEPEKVPSVLSLAPPPTVRRSQEDSPPCREQRQPS